VLIEAMTVTRTTSTNRDVSHAPNQLGSARRGDLRLWPGADGGEVRVCALMLSLLELRRGFG
jgi:hypothetical protein